MLIFFAYRSWYVDLIHLSRISSQIGTKLRDWAVQKEGGRGPLLRGSIVLKSLKNNIDLHVAFCGSSSNNKLICQEYLHQHA